MRTLTRTAGPRVLLVATAGKPADFREQLARGNYPRIDYVDAAMHLPNTSYLDYDTLGSARAWTALEARLRLDLRLAVAARQCVLTHGYDVVVSMSERVGIPLTFLLDRRARHVVMPCHLLSEPKFRLVRSLRIPSRWDSALMLTAAEACALRRACQDARVHVLPRWVDVAFFTPSACDDRPTQAPFIFSVGLSYRDYPTLMAAMARLPQVQCRVRAGSSWTGARTGHERPPANVRVQGMVRQDELRAGYGACRLVVVPIRKTTQWSAGATAVLEAQAMGKPVVATRTPGMSDYVLHGETGLLVEPHDPGALAAAIRELWDDPDRARAMGERARDWTTATFSLELWREQVLRHLAQTAV